MDTNIVGTMNICQAAMDVKLKKLIVTSTSEVYGTAQFVPISEKHPLQPHRHTVLLKLVRMLWL